MLSKFFISSIVMSQRYHFQGIWGWNRAKVTYLLEKMSTGYQETTKPKTLVKGVALTSFRDSSSAAYTDLLIVTETSRAFIYTPVFCQGKHDKENTQRKIHGHIENQVLPKCLFPSTIVP